MIYISTLILLFLSIATFSQSDELSLSTSFGKTTFNKDVRMTGLTYELKLNEKFSFNYNFELGYRSDKGYVAKGPMGVSGGGLLFILSFDNHYNDYFSLGLLACFLPDGISYTHAISNTTSLSPYINFLTLEYSADEIRPSIEFGAKLKHYVSDNFFVLGKCGLHSLYQSKSTSTFFGFGLGITTDAIY